VGVAEAPRARPVPLPKMLISASGTLRATALGAFGGALGTRRLAGAGRGAALRLRAVLPVDRRDIYEALKATYKIIFAQNHCRGGWQVSESIRKQARMPYVHAWP
jgi:hypothetical protein